MKRQRGELEYARRTQAEAISRARPSFEHDFGTGCYLILSLHVRPGTISVFSGRCCRPQPSTFNFYTDSAESSTDHSTRRNNASISSATLLASTKRDGATDGPVNRPS